MNPEFSDWLLSQEPLALNDPIRIAKHATFFCNCVGRIEAFQGDLIGVHLPGLTAPGGLDWYRREDLIKRDEYL